MIAVDASCRKNPGPFEYRGVTMDTGEELFSFSFPHGTNNIGEFLAVVHALSYCKKYKLDSDIYSDSVTAMAWVRDGRCKTTLKPHEDPLINKQYIELIARAESFLKTQGPFNKIIKWDTKTLGEIKADYSRKKPKKKK